MTVYAPVAPKPPLPLSMRRSARLAGGVGFGLMSIGWGLFALAAGIGAFWAFFAFLFAIIRRGGPSARRSIDQFVSAFRDVPVHLVVIALVVGALVGAVIWVVGLFASHAILRRSGHPRPWAVTWAGLGLAVLAAWILSGAAQIVSQVVSAAAAIPTGSSPGAGYGPASTIGAYGAGIGVGVVVWLAAEVAAGVFLWWWMAHVMRPAAPQPTA